MSIIFSRILAGFLKGFRQKFFEDNAENASGIPTRIFHGFRRESFRVNSQGIPKEILREFRRQSFGDSKWNPSGLPMWILKNIEDFYGNPWGVLTRILWRFRRESFDNCYGNPTTRIFWGIPTGIFSSPTSPKSPTWVLQIFRHECFEDSDRNPSGITTRIFRGSQRELFGDTDGNPSVIATEILWRF